MHCAVVAEIHKILSDDSPCKEEPEPAQPPPADPAKEETPLDPSSSIDSPPKTDDPQPEVDKKPEVEGNNTEFSGDEVGIFFIDMRNIFILCNVFLKKNSCEYIIVTP